MTDEENLRQKIDLIRESIRLDWKNLATKSLTFDQRKAIKEDIQMGISALKDLQADLGDCRKNQSRTLPELANWKANCATHKP